ncbi:hypothetical protein D0S45_10905 [Marinifilum sp. JC120]|nr:hypothetical protein D0S45_10905 [Marinifilum sp. JC120]
MRDDYGLKRLEDRFDGVLDIVPHKKKDRNIMKDIAVLFCCLPASHINFPVQRQFHAPKDKKRDETPHTPAQNTPKPQTNNPIKIACWSCILIVTIIMSPANFA